MAFKFGLKAALAAVVTFGLAAAAEATTTFNFSFSAPWFLTTQTGSGSGQLFADLQADGTYQISGVSGTAQSYAGATATSLTSFGGILLGGTPTISGNTTSGFSLNSIQLSDVLSGYTVSKNLLDSNYTISNGLRTTGGASFSLSLASPGAVPEPATWAMMLLGFGAIGAILRAGPRRQRAFA